MLGTPPAAGGGSYGRPPSTGGAAAGSSASSSGPAAKPVRRPGHVGSLSVAQIVLAEVAVLVAVGAATRGLIPGLIAAVAALAVLVLVFARRGHRWWMEHRLIARQHRRRRAAAVDTSAGPALAALRTLAPRLAIHDVTAPDGARVGVARDESGWFAAVAMTPTDPVHAEAAPIPIDALVGVLADVDHPGVVLQLVTHTVPAPSLDLHAASLAGSSYRQLTGVFGPVPVPAHRESTVVVRLDAVALAEALLDHTADPGAAAALTAGLSRRMARGLRQLGIACRALDADELLRALARSCDVEVSGSAPVAPVREDWHEWHSAHLTHRTFWLQSWPATEQIGPLLEWTASIPAAQNNIAIVLNPPEGDGEIVARLLIRIAAPRESMPGLTKHLMEGVARVGGELFPLDGEQGPGVYATAPTGGGAG